jgi:hypothetical protein
MADSYDRHHDVPRSPTRRDFLTHGGAGFGLLGLAGVLQQAGLLAAERSTVPHFTPRAKSVIWLFMHGGPSAVDLFDPKPELDRRDGESMNMGNDVGFFTSSGQIMKSPFAFRQHGESGAWVSEAYPSVARHVDKFAFIKSMHAESNNHGPALYHMNTGMTRFGFPSVGSWVTYGLGTENADLPGFVVMLDHRGALEGGPASWGAGFLPSAYQGTPFRATGTPLLNLQPPAGMTRELQRSQLDFVSALNRRHREAHPGEADLLGRIESFELAYRMQMEAPEAIDVQAETEETKKLYGLDNPVSKFYGSQCLTARRLVERGVRFVQIYSGAHDDKLRWDAHADVKKNHLDRCAETDVPIAGLLTDLERRGLLDSTLVVWGGEFGRLPVSQGESTGRDHNRFGFCVWLAGAGVKGGVSHGATDDIGFKAAVNPVSINDLHATILHLLGLDHLRLTYHHNGRDFRLTDVAGEVVRPILA